MYISDLISRGRYAAAAITVVAASALLGGCIKDDIPYPHIQPNITAIEAEHQAQPCAIDSASRTVTIFLDEAADISCVKLSKLTLTPGAYLTDTAAVVAGLDLSEPYEMTVGLYYDYVWTLTARQSIERYFTVANQVGQSEIDVETHTVKAMVPEALPLTDVEVTSIKLGGTTAEMRPNLVGETVDFTNPVAVAVTEFGRTTEWSVSVTQTDIAVDITQLDAWTNVAWVYVTAEDGRSVGMQYRMSGVDVWTDVPAAWITHTGGTFTGRLINLQPEADYEVRAFSDEDYTLPKQFTTMSNVQLPNSGFENWWMEGRVWCPWVEGQPAFWGTGNKGATTLGTSNTVPVQDPASPTGYHGARLESRFVGISILGKLAAGNLFAGDYVATEGTNGILSFGREFSSYPTKLTGRISYTSATISHSSSGFESMKGQPDTCIVWCALGDWDKPYEIRTNPANRHLFDPADPGVIAYGQMQSGQSTDGFIDFEAVLDYRSTSRKPRYILVVASASKYGDYFTGGNGSVLVVDHFNLSYDY